MSFTFTKLFSSITESTVWCEPDPIRIVWITMLAMADRQGRIWASIPGLANRARVSIPDCEAAVTRFLAPDTYSRTPDHEGRRIEAIDGGWLLLNHDKYRAMRDEESRRTYQREWAKERRQKVSTVDPSRPQSTYAEADTDSEKNSERDKSLSGAERRAAIQKPESPTDGTDADQIWSLGVQILGASSRSLLGRLVKQHGRETVAAKIGELSAMAPRPVDPKSWLVGALKPREERPTRFRTA